MGAQQISIEGTKVKMEVTVELSRSMLNSEENIQQSLNETGCIATEAALKYLDTDGSAIEIAGSVITTKGEQPKAYQNLMVKCGGSSSCLSMFWRWEKLLSLGSLKPELS